jgi:hypothetical protein
MHGTDLRRPNARRGPSGLTRIALPVLARAPAHATRDWTAPETGRPGGVRRRRKRPLRGHSAGGSCALGRLLSGVFSRASSLGRHLRPRRRVKDPSASTGEKDKGSGAARGTGSCGAVCLIPTSGARLPTCSLGMLHRCSHGAWAGATGDIPLVPSCWPPSSPQYRSHNTAPTRAPMHPHAHLCSIRAHLCSMCSASATGSVRVRAQVCARI